VDTTVVETNIHYPTDGSLLGDGVRVLTRSMKNIGLLTAAGAKVRDRMRSTRRCLVHIGRASRSFRTDQGKERLRQCYGRLLTIAGRAVGQAKRFVREVQNGIKAGTCVITQAAIQAHSDYLQAMIPRVQQVMRQTRERLFQGNTRSPG
jgi:IS5 family transposase